MIRKLRNNIGAITSSIGLIILVILLYGNPIEINTAEYWINVKNNIMSISILGFGLVLVNSAIKQGISEQALSTGLNTENTTNKFLEHKELIKKGVNRDVQLSEFLKMFNERETKIRRQEFLLSNNIDSDEVFKKPKLTFKEKRLKRKYFKIKTLVTPSSIKWATTTITYDKRGRLETLGNYRTKRAIKGLLTGTIVMFGMTLVARGLFLDVHQINWLAQTMQLFMYILTISITSIFDVIKNYEKGAFGVPNELDEINTIWQEFIDWEPINEKEKVVYEEDRYIQGQQTEIENI